jgi:hypothetical protein
MTILTSVTEIEDRIVEGVRDIQRPVVDYVRKSVEQAEGRVPKLSYPKVSYPKLSYPKLTVTYPKNLPQPAEVAEVVETQVAFAKALFETQRAFVTELFDAVSPLVESATSTAVDEPVVAVTPATSAPAATSTPTRKVTRKPAVKVKATKVTKPTKA